MHKLSPAAISFFADLLEDAEQTQSICDDVSPWAEAKPLIEELWLVYSDQLTQ